MSTAVSWQLEDFRCHTRLTVRRAEVDAQAIVYNAHYLMYADVALADYWRALALPQPGSWEALGGSLVLRQTQLAYQGSAHLGEVLVLGLRCVRHSDDEVVLACGVFRGRTLLNVVQLRYGWVDTSGQAQPVPGALQALLQAYEAGEPMLRVASGTWNDLGRAAERLRLAVFVREQGVPRELEMDAFDPICRHVVAFNRLEQPVATGRLVTDSPGVGRIGRMAVERSLRGGAWGQQVLQALEQAAAERGDHAVVLHAQCHAQGFYARAGYAPEGAVYEEAGIAHITMRKPLRTPSGL